MRSEELIAENTKLKIKLQQVNNNYEKEKTEIQKLYTENNDISVK